MQTQSIAPRRRSFFARCLNSTRRLALIAPITLGVAVLVGYTATAKSPALLTKIAQMPGSKAQSAEQSRFVKPSTHRMEHILAVPVPLEPVVFTDRPNYFPAETAFITGLGFWPNEVVTLQVVHTDGTSNDGGGHLPWNVAADSLGSFNTSWFVDPDDSAGSAFVLTATGNSSGLVAQTTFTDGSANLDTCANGPASSPVPCTGEAWDNGNLTPSKSHYAEGDSVPYRTIFENLIAGNTYTLTVEYDTTQGGKHAFDYLTSFDRTEPTPGNNPCTQKQGGSIVSICDPLSFVTTPIPVDANVTKGQDGILGNSDDITQVPGVFTLFNGNALSIVNPGSPYTLDGTYAGNSATSITVQFTATSSIAVLAWGGHISTRLNWGLGNSAIAINGSPYHMRLTDITCSGAGETCNVGQQDHQISADAVFFPIELTIIKETNPDNAQVKQFNYTTTGSNLGPFSLTPANGTTPAQTVFSLTDTTARSVTESDPHAAAPEFDLTALSCTQTDGGLGVGTFTTNLVTRTVNFTPKEGQFISCTFVNTEDFTATRGRIIVDKVTNPGGDTTNFDFITTYGSPFSLTDAAAPNDSGHVLVPGSYQVSETANADYDTTTTCTSSLGHPADDPSSINLAAGETVTCTFTNAKKPKLTVTKIVVNDNGGTKQVSDFPLFVDGNSVTSGVKNTSTTGAHTVSETTDPGYTATIGGDCAANGSITLAVGDDKICTVTNDDISPTLRVIKDVVPDTDTGLFNLQIDGATAGTGANAGDGGTTGFVAVNAGNHTVGETAGTGTTLSDYVTVIGGDCAANGTVSLALAQNKTCTITNTKKGMAQVVKTVSGLPPAAGQSFTFELRQGASTVSDGTVLETQNTDASGNINFTSKLVPGTTYQICEWVFPGWNTNLAGDGPLFVPGSMLTPTLPNPNVNNLTVCANFAAQPGQTRTFTVNNSPPPGGRALTIGFWKNWAACSNSNGKGQKPMLDLALGIASAMTTNPPRGLVASAENAGALWPNYAATWHLILKGNPASTADNILTAPDCSRAVNLLNKSTIDGKKKMPSDPLFNMTAQLLAAQLNRFMGAGINGTTIMNIDRSVLLNGKYKFNGLTYNPKLSAVDTNLANCLAIQLDNYNNGNPVSLCP